MNTDTLLGGREITLTFEDKTSRAVTVRQIRVGEYKKAFPLMDDEIALAAFVTGLTEVEVGTLLPASYEELQGLVPEVNKSFFVFAARQMVRAQKQINAMSPEMLKLAMERGLMPSLPPSPASQRPRA